MFTKITETKLSLYQYLYDDSLNCLICNDDCLICTFNGDIIIMMVCTFDDTHIPHLMIPDALLLAI